MTLSPASSAPPSSRATVRALPAGSRSPSRRSPGCSRACRSARAVVVPWGSEYPSRLGRLSSPEPAGWPARRTAMKTVAALMVVALLLIPGVALADSATDAALGLGAFAVFNQIISGPGIFGGPGPRGQSSWLPARLRHATPAARVLHAAASAYLSRRGPSSSRRPRCSCSRRPSTCTRRRCTAAGSRLALAAIPRDWRHDRHWRLRASLSARPRPTACSDASRRRTIAPDASSRSSALPRPSPLRH